MIVQGQYKESGHNRPLTIKVSKDLNGWTLMPRSKIMPQVVLLRRSLYLGHAKRDLFSNKRARPFDIPHVIDEGGITDPLARVNL